MKNTGKDYEKLFEQHLLRTRKKNYFLHRMTDAADVRGRTGKTGFQPRQPSDYVTVIDGVTSLTEVKSTQHPTSFPFGLLGEHQHGKAKQALNAGGNYVVFVYSIVHEKWFRVPYEVIVETEKQSIPWTEMEKYLWV